MIGAGSVGFTRQLVRDLLSVPEFAEIEIALTDINPHNLDMTYQLIQRDIESNGIPAKLTASTDRRASITGAKYIFSFIRAGGLEAFVHDVDIPLKYGVDQCVGDTLGPGGIMYAQRGIPPLLDFCKDIREVAAPGALFLNYSNPMAMLTWACNHYGGVDTVGLCHGVQGGHWQLAQVIEVWARNRGMIGADEKVAKKDVDIVCAGINHQTWYVKVQWRGIDMVPNLLDAFLEHPEYPTTEKVRIDMLRRFGYYSTESNGHLSEYVPWYRKRTHEIEKWIDLGTWINGETGGYLRVCTEGRNWFEHDFPNWMSGPPMEYGADKRGEEHGSYIVEGLETGRVYRGHFNRVNNGVITNLPADCIIEAPGYVDKNGISMPIVGDLPMGCAAVCSASVWTQRLAVEASLRSDLGLLKQAMMMDPLTGAVCNPPEIWQMTDEMLVALIEWLPQWADELSAAQDRLASEAYIPTMEGNRGAARLHTKSVDEMEAKAEESRKNAQEADKAKERPKASA